MPDPEPTPTAFRERRYTAQDGLSLYYREYGDPLSPGVPVLCLPGLARNSKDFHRLALRLRARHWVVCPDYRGRGRSGYDADSENYQPATYLNDIRHLLAVTGMRHAAVIGTSMGGLLACAMGAAMPTVLAGVVLNDVGPDIGSDGLGRIMAYLSQDNPQPDWESAFRAFKALFPNLSLRTEEDWRAATEATWREGEDGVLHYDWDIRIVDPLRHKRPLPDLWALFRSIRRYPVLALRGGASDVLLPETFERMASEHPRLERLTIERVGHVPTLVEPEAAGAIDAFLARLG
ncbi:MAG: alpha/beta fold hydrolase [Alphaproteobacteria bacterium]